MDYQNCTLCKTDFVIQLSDKEFYAELGVSIPALCPRCRALRKMLRRNERTLYKRGCDLCQKNIISMYAADSRFTVYCVDCWWSDAWDPMEYGVDYNFSKNFFEQFYALSLRVPRLALFQKGNIDSPYTNHADHVKNTYLAFNNGFVEDCMYSKWLVRGRDMYDCYSVFDSELMYECQSVEKCYRCRYVSFSTDCVNSTFLFNCRACQNCFMCSNLRSKNYCIRNKQYPKDEYEKIIAGYDLGNFDTTSSLSREFFYELLPSTLRKYGMISNTYKSTGDYLSNCKGVRQSFNVSGSEESAYCVDSAGVKDSLDVYESAFDVERQYECHGCNRTSRSVASSVSYDSFDLNYCEMCHNSSSLFGCIGLRKKDRCILNKQYAKDDYEALMNKIKTHMSAMPFTDNRGVVHKYGDFFPAEHSPFSYNETLGAEYFPLSKVEAVECGYAWKDAEGKSYQSTMPTEAIPNSISSVMDSVTADVLACFHNGVCNEQCTGAFHILKKELEFYRMMNIPIPHLCPNCRHHGRLNQRNPMKLWSRECACLKPGTAGQYENTTIHTHDSLGCPNKFETTYAPDRRETVYCESCYLAEVQ